MKLVNLIGIAVILLLTACSFAPKKEVINAEFEIPASFNGKADSLAWLVSVDSVVPDKWWHGFNDAALNAFVDTVLVRNLDLRTALESEGLLRNRIKSVGVQYLPNVVTSFSANATSKNTPVSSFSMGATGPAMETRRVDTVIEKYSLGMSLNYTLDFWGKIKNQKRAAIEQFYANAHELRKLYSTIVSATIISWYSYQSSIEHLQFAESSLELSESQLHFQQRRYEQGVGSKLEYEQALSAVAGAKSSVISAKQDMELAQNALVILAGYYPEQISVEQSTAFSKVSLPQVPLAVPSDILRSRPDIAAAANKVEAARYEIGAAKADFFPRFTITPSISFSNGEIKGMFDEQNLVKMLGGNVAHILFTRPIVKINVKSKEALYRQAVLSYKKTMLSAFHEVENALIKTQRTHELAEATANQVGALERITIEMERRYIDGLLPYETFLTSQDNLYKVKKAALSMKMATIANRVQLVTACGGLM